ncbi:SUKH-3 domain-containing protein [Streptomyces gamaensis]|uniref:SUKH-3 domain-containing protein n=1 Tax=Streptomyces gamaensis TaxID=1763542 RepID=A0ABW0Z2M1_9ACTN
MTVGDLSPEAVSWLTDNGWFPGRDIGAECDELVNVCVRDSERQGAPLQPFDAASRIIRTYGLLKLKHPRVSGCILEMDPTVGYEGDAGVISELASNLGCRLFPVGFESEEFGLVLVDERGRFFYLHHTGGYFWGADENEAFMRFMTGADAPDAEDFFV